MDKIFGDVFMFWYSFPDYDHKRVNVRVSAQVAKPTKETDFLRILGNKGIRKFQKHPRNPWPPKKKRLIVALENCKKSALKHFT